LNFLTSTYFRRLLLVLLPFTAIVVYGYSELIFSSMKTAENRTVQEYLRSEYALFERQYAETGSEQLPSAENLSAWWAGDANLPASFSELEPGIHLVDGERHLLVAVPEGAGRRAYFLLTEPELGTTMIRAEMESTIYLYAIVVFISGGLLAVIVGWLMSRPIRALADEVRSGHEPGKELQGHNRSDEIGVLSRALGSLINRMESALMREQAVTRYASHDMRTPVAVIRIALSVLNLPECDADKRKRNLERIDKACAEIEDSIEVHLCLARESAELPEEDCDVRAMVADEFANHAHAVDAKNLSVSIDGADTNFSTVRPMLKVVLRNLIQNAVSYSGQSIHVAIDADGFVIRNSSDMTDAQVSEEGLGLGIVQRVCDRMGWGFSAHQQGGEFVAHVVLQPDSKAGK
jgi:signal transduction histidine kinase